MYLAPLAELQHITEEALLHLELAVVITEVLQTITTLLEDIVVLTDILARKVEVQQ